MNTVDSSGWIAYFFGTANADFFSKPILKISKLLVPSICLYEVFKKISQEAGIAQAKDAVAQMKQGKILSIGEETALSAASLSQEYRLPMADSLIYASTLQNQATLWTQDEDFEGLPWVKYCKVRKKKTVKS